MKRILLSAAIISMVFIGASCDDQKSADSTTTTTEGTSSTTTVDTPRKTTISIGSGGASISTKKGTEIKVDNKGTKVENKNVKVDIKTGN